MSFYDSEDLEWLIELLRGGLGLGLMTHVIQDFIDFMGINSVVTRHPSVCLILHGLAY